MEKQVKKFEITEEEDYALSDGLIFDICTDVHSKLDDFLDLTGVDPKVKQIINDLTWANFIMDQDPKTFTRDGVEGWNNEMFALIRELDKDLHFMKKRISQIDPEAENE